MSAYEKGLNDGSASPLEDDYTMEENGDDDPTDTRPTRKDEIPESEREYYDEYDQTPERYSQQSDLSWDGIVKDEDYKSDEDVIGDGERHDLELDVRNIVTSKRVRRPRIDHNAPFLAGLEELMKQDKTAGESLTDASDDDESEDGDESIHSDDVLENGSDDDEILDGNREYVPDSSDPSDTEEYTSNVDDSDGGSNDDDDDEEDSD